MSYFAHTSHSAWGVNIKSPKFVKFCTWGFRISLRTQLQIVLTIDVYFGPVTRVLLMKGFDEKGVMHFVWSEVLKYNVFNVRISSPDNIPNRYWITNVTVKYAVFFRMRDGVSLPVMFRYDCVCYGESQLFLDFMWKQYANLYSPLDICLFSARIHNQNSLPLPPRILICVRGCPFRISERMSTALKSVMLCHSAEKFRENALNLFAATSFRILHTSAVQPS